MKWQDCLNEKAQEIVKHGQGKITFNVGPTGIDETNILIEAGRTYRFTVDRVKVYEQDD